MEHEIITKIGEGKYRASIPQPNIEKDFDLAQEEENVFLLKQKLEKFDKDTENSRATILEEIANAEAFVEKLKNI